MGQNVNLLENVTEFDNDDDLIIIKGGQEVKKIKTSLFKGEKGDVGLSIEHRGEYVSNSSYYKLNVVSKNGSSFVSLVDNNTENPELDNNKWKLLASKGADGEGGDMYNSNNLGNLTDYEVARDNLIVYSIEQIDNNFSLKTHNHNLNDLSEKSYNSLTDTPDLSDLHNHNNKTVLDNFGEDENGKPTYNGNTVDTTIAQRDVYNGLDSTDTTISLSANMGNELDEKKANLDGNNIFTGSYNIFNGDIKIWKDGEKNLEFRDLDGSNPTSWTRPSGTVDIGYYNGGYKFYINGTSGNVGILTTIPTEALEVNGNIKIKRGETAKLYIENTTNGEAQIDLKSNGNYTRFYHRQSDGKFGIYMPLVDGTNYLTRFGIKGDGNGFFTYGNFGIGETSAGAKIDVKGDGGIVAKFRNASQEILSLSDDLYARFHTNINIEDGYKLTLISSAILTTNGGVILNNLPTAPDGNKIWKDGNILKIG